MIIQFIINITFWIVNTLFKMNSCNALLMFTLQTWKHLLSKIDQHNELTIQVLISSFLEFMFVGVGSIKPACKVLNKECADVFSQMLKTPSLFRVLPEQFIKYTFICIESVCNNLSLSMSLWNLLIGKLWLI